MVTLGTPLTDVATKLLLLGSGELGKEVAIEAQRLGIEVIAVDRYSDAPAMQVAHRSHVVDMLDGDALGRVIELEKPDLVVPEVESIATDVLLKYENMGVKIIPNARATSLTMNREGIRRLAAEELSIQTSPYYFANSLEECAIGAELVGFPCVIKPIMSSSGRGQTVAHSKSDIESSWIIANRDSRGNTEKVIVEGFVDFDYEITLLTIRHVNGTTFCPPIGHIQTDGDYRESWQPHDMDEDILKRAQSIAENITSALGGSGIFGVELFVKGDAILFSEVSPRPHDTGMVTLISQNYSEFALHVRAILGLPMPSILQIGPAASCALVAEGESDLISFGGLDDVLSDPDIDLRLFGKPTIHGHRRLGVVLSRGDDIRIARQKANEAMKKLLVVMR